LKRPGVVSRSIRWEDAAANYSAHGTEEVQKIGHARASTEYVYGGESGKTVLGSWSTQLEQENWTCIGFNDYVRKMLVVHWVGTCWWLLDRFLPVGNTNWSGTTQMDGPLVLFIEVIVFRAPANSWRIVCPFWIQTRQHSSWNGS